jgi:hypothetical protein
MNICKSGTNSALGLKALEAACAGAGWVDLRNVYAAIFMRVQQADTAGFS